MQSYYSGVRGCSMRFSAKTLTRHYFFLTPSEWQLRSQDSKWQDFPIMPSIMYLPILSLRPGHSCAYGRTAVGRTRRALTKADIEKKLLTVTPNSPKSEPSRRVFPKSGSSTYRTTQKRVDPDSTKHAFKRK